MAAKELFSLKYQEQLGYWERRLQNGRPAEFLTDKPRPPTITGKAAFAELKIDGSLYGTLLSFCRSTQVTVFTALLSVFRAVHYRLTGSSDAVIGCPTASRDRPEIKDIIGFFVNVQCIRTEVDDRTTFSSLLQKEHLAVTESLGNQDIPFESVVSKLQIGRSLSRQPLAQLGFTLHSQQNLTTFEFEGLQSETLDIEVSTRFDMEFHWFQVDSGLEGKLIYSRDLFDKSSAQTILSTFVSFLTRWIRTPDVAISDMLLPQPKNCVANSWLGICRETASHYPRNSSVIDVFDRQVTMYPNALAVEDSVTRLTYKQLQTKSDAVANWLKRRLVDNETLVGIFGTRSCETVVAILGILKANFAYVPMDSRMPLGRLESVLSSFSNGIMLLVGTNVDVPPIKLNSITCTPIADTLERLEGSHSWPLPGPKSLAYVMFTSGSTGEPKGVMIEHRGVVRLVKGNNMMQHNPEFPVVAHMANIDFDASTWEIFSALLNGGTLLCIPQPTVLEPADLLSLFRRTSINSALFTPVLLHQYLLSYPEIVSDLKVLYVGGDTLQPQTVIIARQFMQGPIVNAYGPTENTVVSTIYCIPEYEQYGNGVPIGKPLTNSGAFIMDHHQRLVPNGVIGELVVTGDGLARGYLDPKLNDPFIIIEVDGQTVPAYRTGDRARVRPGMESLSYWAVWISNSRFKAIVSRWQKSSTLYANKIRFLPPW